MVLIGLSGERPILAWSQLVVSLYRGNPATITYRRPLCAVKGQKP
jgi:hypothetical protein